MTVQATTPATVPLDPSVPSPDRAASVDAVQQPAPPAPGPPLLRLQHEPEIVLTWLVRLRWLAAAGQILATTAAHWLFGLDIALVPIACVIGLTIASNLLLVQLMRSHATHVPRGTRTPRSRASLVPAVLRAEARRVG